uniref:Uncharacterized protein n=1 Tax=Ananas comosus var. bracteatus TaxID=296719 RepID=A0A6V7PSQ9_ANACO|nr:unnamed protein product [Ananas comosus var. bracteatus]
MKKKKGRRSEGGKSLIILDEDDEDEERGRGNCEEDDSPIGDLGSEISQNCNDGNEGVKEVEVIDVFDHEEEENERRAGEAQGISDSHLEKEMPDEDVDVDDDDNDADDEDDKDCDDNNNDDCAGDDVGSGGNGSGENDQRKVGGAKRVLVASCDASRTRPRMGKQKRFSHTSYFKDVSDDSGQKGDEEEEEEEEEEKEVEEEKEDVNGEPDHGTNGESSLVFIKKKVPGSSAKNNGEAPPSISVAQRTRPHFSLEQPKKKQRLGTLSNPFCSDVNDFVLESEMGLLSSNEEAEKGSTKGNAVNDNKKEGGVRQDTAKSWKSNKRKHVEMLKGQSLFELLADTICSDKKEPLEDSVPPDKDPSPFKQNFCDEQLPLWYFLLEMKMLYKLGCRKMRKRWTNYGLTSNLL